MKVGDAIVERFVLEELAGSGGVGAVYRAYDRQLGEHVALKLLREDSLEDEPRFLREASILQELRHPRIVRHVGHGVSAQNVPYLVMEWLPGTNLSVRLREGPLSVPASVGVALGAAQALQAAHSAGIVHRDVKPNNLMYVASDPGAVKLFDFGIARRVVSHSVTARGSWVGTPGYLAPEQARGSQEVDPRADVFSLGCVLFECLSGRPAFSADHLMALLAKLVFEEAPRVSELCDEVPAALDDLIARMLAKDPAERPADAGAVASELESIHAALGRVPVAGPRSSRRLLTHHEQRLVSVVAATGDAHETVEPSESSSDPILSLSENLARLGTRLEKLADGSLVCALTDPIATDLAGRAARCALILRDWFPGAKVVITTGRGLFAGRLPVGEAIDRAVSLIRAARRGEQSVIPVLGQPIEIDALSADLFDSRFEVREQDRAFYLVGERDPLITSRTLLGKATPCVGRDRELAFLEATFHECEREGSARVTLITGSPGLGKSRLLSEFATRLASKRPRPELWLARADVTGQNSSFSLLAQLVRHAAGVRGGEPASASRRKLRARTQKALDDSDALRVAQFLGELSGVHFEHGPSELQSARSESALMASQIERAWCDFVAAEARERPLVVVLDDLHWGDLASVKLLSSAVRQSAARPLMVLALARPSVHQLFPNLFADAGLEELRLGALSPKASERLVESVFAALPGAAPPKHVVSEIVARAEGNAFFLEELIRAIATGRTELPATLLSMTQGRLDALDVETRRVLRAASVFGDAFWRAGLLTLLGGKVAEQQLASSLNRLIEEELVMPQSSSRFTGEDEYTFRHALVRDAAYSTLTERDRELGHRLAARWLEERGDRDPTRLAEHHERGGQPKEAALWYRRAAEQALEGSDLDLAIERARHAMDTGAEGELRGQLYIIQGEAYSWRGDSRAAEECGTKALPLLTKGGPEWCWGAGATFMLRTQLGDIAGAAQILAELAQITPTDEATTPYVKGCALAVSFLCYAGMYDMANTFSTKIDERLARSDDPLVSGWAAFARSFIIAFCEGRVAAHEATVREGLLHFSRAGDARGQTVMRVSLGVSQRVLGQFETALATLEQAQRTAGELGLTLFGASAKLQQGVVHAELGNHRLALELVVQAAHSFREQGNQIFVGLAGAYAARSFTALGIFDHAEHEAELAAGALGPAPTFRAFAESAGAELELARGRPERALELAQKAHQTLSELGSVAEGDAHIRYTYALALEACAHVSEARAAFRAARSRLLERAADLEDDEARARFFERPTLNARICARGALLDSKLPRS